VSVIVLTLNPSQLDPPNLPKWLEDQISFAQWLGMVHSKLEGIEKEIWDFVDRQNCPSDKKYTLYLPVMRHLLIEKWLPHYANPESIDRLKKEYDKENKWKSVIFNIYAYWNDSENMFEIIKSIFKLDMKAPLALPVYIKENQAKVEKAFSVRFPDSEKPCEALMVALGNVAQKWKSSVYYFPGTSIVQSSGMGKSRAIIDLAHKGVYVFYCSFLMDESSGYPKKSSIASSLKGNLHDFRKYFQSCLKFLNTCLTPSSNGQIMSSVEFLEQQKISDPQQDTYSIQILDMMKSNFSFLFIIDRSQW
jgi:hypothetical protein